MNTILLLDVETTTYSSQLPISRLLAAGVLRVILPYKSNNKLL